MPRITYREGHTTRHPQLLFSSVKDIRTVQCDRNPTQRGHGEMPRSTGPHALYMSPRPLVGFVHGLESTAIVGKH